MYRTGFSGEPWFTISSIRINVADALRTASAGWFKETRLRQIHVAPRSEAAFLEDQVPLYTFVFVDRTVVVNAVTGQLVPSTLTVETQ